MSQTETTSTKLLTVRELSIWKRTARRSYLVRDLSFDVLDGRVLALIGPSGVGKSSVLNAIAGFVPIEGGGGWSIWDWQDEGDGLRFAGSVRVGGRPVERVPVEKRDDIGMVMQGGLVYEHLSVLDNVAFPLNHARRVARRDLRTRVAELLEQAELIQPGIPAEDLDELLRQKASRLSGGQKQRVAIARALAKDPKVFLLDEAFANLDPVLRGELFGQVVKMVRSRNKCAVIVTHDLSDLSLADDIVLLGRDSSGTPAHRHYRRNSQGFDLTSSHGASSCDWAEWDRRIPSA